ncbi:MAG: biotin/lipoyl-containing protein [Pseudomonadota bacterium]
MTTFHISDSPQRHQVQLRSDEAYVDGSPVQVRQTSTGYFVAQREGRTERLRAVAHGDAVYVQLKGRVWQINRVDPTRASAGADAPGAGLSKAPMPGVVVTVLASVGQQVAQGDALMVIESMKLQMTISAGFSGRVAEMPFAVGQTFQRNDTLARLEEPEVSGAAA